MPAMNHPVILFLFVALLAFLVACGDLEPSAESFPEGYHESFREWEEHRIGVLTDTTGWLRLVDRIWFAEGENTFGSGEDHDVRFPEGSIPENAGTFILRDGEVFMEVNDGVEVFHDGEPVTSLAMLVEDGDERIHAHHGDLTWFIDRQGDQRGVKIFRGDRPEADDFEGFPRYDLRPEWYLQGRFVPRSEGNAIEVENVLGETVRRRSPGRVEFEIAGERHTLDVFEASNGFFLMFADLTNDTETYQAGRYLMVDPPDADGVVTIDFNKAYNPPCAFSRFTTCQLPPPQNRLDVAVTAGEKRPVGFEGI